jgi:hypothetical protein
MTADASWGERLRLGQLAKAGISRRIAPGAEERARIARELGVNRLDSLEAELTLKPWLDGVEIAGRWRASLEQTCGVTLEPLPQSLEGSFEVRALPAGSPHAPDPAAAEVVVDLESEDPPDILEGDEIDLAGYVVEQLALGIDPFPRAPGAEFVQPEGADPPSPFEALRNFKASGGEG